MKRQSAFLFLLSWVMIISAQVQSFGNYWINAGSASGSNVRFISNHEGLNGENVNKIFRDSHDLVWIGTNAGLDCYNGASLYHFRFEDINRQSSSQDVCSSSVNDIIETPDGRIVVATDNGLYEADIPTLSCRRLSSDGDDAISLCMLSDHLFVGSSKGLCRCSKDGAISTFNIENNVLSSGNAVVDLCAHDGSHLWACTSTRLILFSSDGHKVRSYSITGHLAKGNITCLAKRGNMLYVGTSSSGVLTFDIKSGKVVPTPFVVPQAYIQDLNLSGNILYVSSNKSYAINLTTFKADEYPSTYTLWHDAKFDIIWQGYFLHGMSHDCYNRKLFHVYRYKTLDTSTLDVRSMHRHGDDMLIGTRQGFYYVNEVRDIVRYYSPEEIGSRVITDIRWFAGRFVLTTFENSILTFDPKNLSVVHLCDDRGRQLNGNFSFMSLSPDNSRLYISGSLGILVFDKDLNLIHQFNHQNSRLPDQYIPEIFIDSEGKGWIGTMKQLCIYDHESETIITDGFPKDYFNNVGILSFNQSGKSVFAFSGATIYESSLNLSKYKTHDLSPILHDKSINFVFPVGDKFLIGTTNGLFLFNHDFKSYTHFSGADNLPGMNFNKQQIQRTDDGTIWMANSNGVISLNAGDLAHLQDSIAGHAIICNMLIDERRQPDGKILNLNVEPSITLSWNFGQESLSVVPLMLNYAGEAGNYYEYSVDGETFKPSADAEEISITGLFIGRHTLALRLAGHPETTTQYMITVLPSAQFYFEIAFVVLLVIVIWSMVSYRRRVIQHRQRLRVKHQLEREISAETAVRNLQEEQQQERLAREQAQEEARQQRASTREYRELQRKVVDYMELERPYLNANFRLTDLAKAVGSNATMISLMLNQNLNISFFDFVTRYRLEEFKRRMKSDKYKSYTMTAISEQCGFKRSSFFAAFKKFEGITPTEWAKDK